MHDDVPILQSRSSNLDHPASHDCFVFHVIHRMLFFRSAFVYQYIIEDANLFLVRFPEDPAEGRLDFYRVHRSKRVICRIHE